MRRSLIWIATIVISTISCTDSFVGHSVPCVPEVPANPAHPKDAALQALLAKYVKKGLPGISLLITDEAGTWTGSAGKADIGRGVAMSTCHISKAASITKMFVAVVTMQLVEEQTLELDRLITTWLPHSITRHIANAERVTLRQLLNHRAGIYDIIEDNSFYLEIINDPTKRRTLEELVRFVYDKPAVFAPGDSAAYSNTNTLLVSMILERVTGKSYERLIQERILTPLGLGNTTFITDGVLPPSTAQGYYDLYNNGTIVNLSNYNTASGYGGMYSNVFDLEKFMKAFLVDRILLTGGSISEMLTFSPNEENGKLIGLGTMKDFLVLGEGNFAYGHRGRDLAYTADLFYFPNHATTLALLVNYGTDANSSLRPVFNEFREELGQVIVR